MVVERGVTLAPDVVAARKILVDVGALLAGAILVEPGAAVRAAELIEAEPDPVPASIPDDADDAGRVNGSGTTGSMVSALPADGVAGVVDEADGGDNGKAVNGAPMNGAAVNGEAANGAAAGSAANGKAMNGAEANDTAVVEVAPEPSAAEGAVAGADTADVPETVANGTSLDDAPTRVLDPSAAGPASRQDAQTT
jgi:hypothetical protein